MRLNRLIPLLMFVVMGMVSATAAEMVQEEAVSSIESLSRVIDKDIEELGLLRTLIRQDKGSTNNEALQYRLDGRSFALLSDVDKLVARVAVLPRGSEQRKSAEQVLSKNISTIGVAVFERLAELKTLLDRSRAERDSLSGGARISMSLYIYSLESIRFDYYDALIRNFESRKTLGLSSDDLQEQLEADLYLHTEKLAGQVELADSTLQELQTQLELDPANADLDTSLKSLAFQHKVYISRLETAINLLERLDVDTTEYKAVLLKGSGEFSVDMLERGVLRGVLADGLQVVKEAVVANSPDILFKTIIFFAILLIFRFLSRLTKRLVQKSCENTSLDLSVLLKDILISMSGGVVMVLGVFMALSQIGISLGPMLAGLGVAGFVIGFALQDTLGNFAAGAMILIYRPYDVDDFVEVTGASGLVKNMNLVSTTITTFDNQTLVVPNSKIWGDVIKNVTAQKVRRVDLEFGIGYGDDIEHAERVMHDVLSQHEMVLKKPETMIKLHSLGESSVNFIVRPWAKTEDYWDVYWDITREIKMRFDKEGISIPFPQRDVHVFTESS
ncbi:MAG: mechanosensitive ion channel [Proteobacteria bacterium]|nr:mechanosensitive ion channel [Pseudomonadota bacterium]